MVIAVTNKPLQSFHHFFEGFAVDVGYCYGYVADVHYQTAVTVYTHYVSFKSGKGARKYSNTYIVLGIVFQAVNEKTYSFGVGFKESHKRSHSTVGNNGRLMCATIFYEI